MRRLLLEIPAIIPLVKAHLFKMSAFSLLFVFVKLNAFTAAIFLSNFVETQADYGLFEYALSIGLILAIPFNFGLQGAYPYFKLKLRKERFRSVFHFHCLLVTALVLFLFVVNQWILNLIPFKISLALLFGAIVAMQVLQSTILKSHEVLVKAILLDGGFFLVLNSYNLWLYLSGSAFDFSLLTAAFLGYLLLLFSMHFWRFWIFKSDFSFSNYWQALDFGRHLLASAFFIVCLSGIARVFIEYFLGLEEVAIYAFYFRFSAALVLIHQIVNIVFFKKMYEAPVMKLDFYFSGFLFFVFVIGVMLFYLVPPMLIQYLSLLEQSWPEYQRLYFILSCQMVFWIGMALFENILYREQLSAKMNRWFGPLVLALILSWCGLYWLGLLSIFSLTFMNLIGLFLACEIQLYLLRKHGFDFVKTRRVNAVLFMVFTGSYFLFLN